MVGHASLSYQQLDFVSYETIEDLSFWPCRKTRVSQVRGANPTDVITRKHHYSIFSKSLDDDRYSEKKYENATITIRDFDDIELAMFIQALKARMPKYHLSKYNCSSVVAAALRAATHEKPNERTAARGFGNLVWFFGRGVWTPTTVMRYANQLAH